MSQLSKFFTPPLSERERASIYESFGFGKLSYRFMERSGPYVLRARNYTGQDFRSTLEPLSDLTSDEHLPMITVQRAFRQREGSHRLQTLWEEIFPYPFSLLGRLFLSNRECEVQLVPASLKGQLKLLWEALQRLDEHMGSTEVNVVWIKGGSRWEPIELPMVFHYVRRKRVRVGTTPNLQVLGEKYRAGQLDHSVLRSQFGTQSAFYYLGLEELADGPDFIPSLVARLLRLLDYQTGAHFSPSSGEDPFPLGPSKLHAEFEL